MLKETGVRSGEAWLLKWTDFNFENSSVAVTPEKGGEPRLLKISNRLTGMFNSLPKGQPQVFQGSPIHFGRSYRRQRKRVSKKLSNERISRITFHTFRHFKATMEFHKTRDILHVMKMLGHGISRTLSFTRN